VCKRHINLVCRLHTSKESNHPGSVQSTTTVKYRHIMKILVKIVLSIFVLNTISCVAPRRIHKPRRSMVATATVNTQCTTGSRIIKGPRGRMAIVGADGRLRPAGPQQGQTMFSGSSNGSVWNQGVGGWSGSSNSTRTPDQIVKSGGRPAAYGLDHGDSNGY
jgi:hypothetical protein